MIQTTLNDNQPTCKMTTTTSSSSTFWYFVVGNVAHDKFGVWSKEMDDLLYDQQAFGL